MKILIAIAFTLCLSTAFAQQSGQQLSLWPNGAPGSESRRNEPEQAKDWWVRNIHNPSITVFFPPKEKATGTAVVICPGGGHKNLVYNSEGKDPAVFFNSIGVTAIVLKYRLFREENSTYTLERDVKADAYRAMRTVRSRAKKWNVDPSRIGIMGFSAGGETVALVAYGNGNGDPQSADPIERENGKPNFQILIYPGPLGIPDSVSSDAPPAFVLAANDDECCAAPIIKLLGKYREAKVPVEAHIYAQGNHAFNMGTRSKLISIKNWPQRLSDWMEDSGLLKPPAR